MLVALAIGPVGCAKPSEAEQVADSFVDAYFRRMDQEAAKKFTALGATTMLDQEMKEVAALRKDGYGPSEASDEVVCKRAGPATPRDQRVRVPYEITVKSSGASTVRDADVELAKIEGAWKVVRIGLKAR